MGILRDRAFQQKIAEFNWDTKDTALALGSAGLGGLGHLAERAGFGAWDIAMDAPRYESRIRGQRSQIDHYVNRMLEAAKNMRDPANHSIRWNRGQLERARGAIQDALANIKNTEGKIHKLRSDAGRLGRAIYDKKLPHKLISNAGSTLKGLGMLGGLALLGNKAYQAFGDE